VRTAAWNAGLCQRWPAAERFIAPPRPPRAMSLVRYGSWSWATDTASSHRRSIPRFCPSDRRVAAEIPGAIQPAFKSKVKPLIQQRTLKASRRVSTVEKMHTADVATPVSSAKKRHCRGFGNCVRNPSVQFAHRARTLCAYTALLQWLEGCPRPCITTGQWRTSCARPRAIKIWPNSRRKTSLS
jgi:hypothetical protein